MLKRTLKAFHSCKIALFAVFVGFAFSLAGCGGGNGSGTVNPEPETTKSSSCTLSNFQFSTTANSGLSVNASAVIKQIQGLNMVLITVPEIGRASCRER